MKSLIARRLRGRKDSEHVQAVIRVVITALVALYLNSNLGTKTGLAEWGDILSIIYFGISILLLGWIIIRPDVSYLRRYSAMIGEHVFVSLGLLLEGERAAPLFLIYVWVSLGNGFRYGVRSLVLSTVVSTVGFIAVIAQSPFWQSVFPISAGIVLTMIAIPLYAASLIRQLQAAKSAAEQANHSKSRFLATASHELRTPLHAIIGLSELLQQTSLSSEQVEMVQTVRGSGRALLSLVEDVLDLSSIQAGRIESQVQAFNLYEAVAETVAIARPQAGQKNLDLAVRISPSIPASLQGDWPHLRQILLNIMTNAIKFTDKGQVSLTVEALSVTGGDVRLSFAISDTGIGIAPKDMERIFETFGQANTSSTRKYGGVGLGLAIVRQLADLLHGSVSVDSTPGEGSTFTVELPFLREPPLAEKADRHAAIVVHSADKMLLPALCRMMPGTVIIGAGADIPSGTNALVTLVDTRHGIDRIDDISRQIADAQHGMPASIIALGALAPEIRHIAPAIVSCIPELDAEKIRNAIDIGCTLAVHREVLSALQGDKELMAVPTFKPDESMLADGVRVLVVEDSPVNRMVTNKILRSAGYSVILADSADAGLDYLSEQEFDIVLLDLNMPGTSGIDIIKLYRVMRLGQTMPPIVIFSADVTEESRAECVELGVSLFLPKPSEPSYILQQLAILAPQPAPVAVPEKPAVEPGPVVEISSHPRYNATPELGIVDRHALQSLASLDAGLSFLNELIDEFEKDTVELLDLIDRSVRDRNLSLFWDQIHAMRSSAANVGAKQILTACMEINAEGKLSFHKRGFEYAARLRYEFNRFQRTMDRFLQAQAKAR